MPGSSDNVPSWSPRAAARVHRGWLRSSPGHARAPPPPAYDPIESFDALDDAVITTPGPGPGLRIPIGAALAAAAKELIVRRSRAGGAADSVTAAPGTPAAARSEPPGDGGDLVAAEATPTPIQAELWGAVVATALGRPDIVAAAPTGSGKTLAFAVPVSRSAIHSAARHASTANPSARASMAVHHICRCWGLFFSTGCR